MKTSIEGISLIKKYEGLKLEAYLCPAGVWTIGYGTTIYPIGEKVKQGDICTEVQAGEYLLVALAELERNIQSLIKDEVRISQGMFDALVSFVFNVGIGRFKKSTLLRLLNRGLYLETSKQFSKWTKAKGRSLSGLVKRRRDETELFLKGVSELS